MLLAFKLSVLVLLISWSQATPTLLTCADVQQTSTCTNSDGTSSCCPIRDGVCCPNTDFCCPRGFECDASNGRCVRDKMSIPFYLKLSPVKQDQYITCPDNQRQCKKSSQSCCQLADNTYGCCPMTEAVCCDDKVHCCPKNYACNIEKGKCDLLNGLGELISFSWKEKVINDVVCPGGSSECPTGTTCCPLADGEYGCCPMEKAVCCEDHEHCCPNGYTCDVKDGRCNKGEISLPFVRKFAAKSINKKVEDVVCPGGQDSCPTGSTCCQLTDGSYGCCPIENAVCCSDHEHCCPSGYTCDVKDGRCNKGEVSLPFLRKTPSKKVKSVVCPGGQDECPNGSTCCQLNDGEFGCCPLENAVCCSDHVHCCPNGYTCDVKDGRCNKDGVSLPFLKKFGAKKVNKPASVDDIVCPGGQDQCPSGTTCCQLDDKSYGCCPMENAVCCEDHEHCCPTGYTCDVKDGRCNKGDISLPFVRKFASKKVNKKVDEDIVCPGGQDSCPNGSTCCQLDDGSYGCCPIPNAVCCEDHLHCCPSGYTCDVKDGRCNKGKQSLPFLRKFKAKKVNTVKESVMCPDGQNECSAGSTCCKLSGGSYGCCPLENAVCCEDHLHCCPNGYTCDEKGGRCTRGFISIPFYKKKPATQSKQVKQGKPDAEAKKPESGSVVCPDRCSFCPNGFTCCELSDKSYGCCPLEQAVCCSDHLHCCPKGTVCDLRTQSCDSTNHLGQLIKTSWFKKVPAKLIYNREKPVAAADPVLCGDNSTKCGPLKTCCKMENNGYGCCNYVDGVCCSWGCCPKGKTCGKNFGECLSEHKVEHKLHRIELKAEQMPQVEENSASACSLSTPCKNTTTCCDKPDGSYSCCPYPNGICCGSHGYCCPDGYSCADPKLETCVLNDDLKKSQVEPIKMSQTKSKTKKSTNKKITLLSLTGRNEDDVPCPDDELNFCERGHTCCKANSNSNAVGCCPSEGATCCSDGVNCCPSGFRCAKLSSGGLTCSKIRD